MFGKFVHRCLASSSIDTVHSRPLDTRLGDLIFTRSREIRIYAKLADIERTSITVTSEIL